jgi:predicted RNase H-like HicB family nuclease
VFVKNRLNSPFKYEKLKEDKRKKRRIPYIPLFTSYSMMLAGAKAEDSEYSNTNIPSSLFPAVILDIMMDDSPPQQRLKKTYNVVLAPGESHTDWSIARCDELHVNTQGKTAEEAIQNAHEAINLVVDELGLEKDFILRIQRKF